MRKSIVGLMLMLVAWISVGLSAPKKPLRPPLPCASWNVIPCTTNPWWETTGTGLGRDVRSGGDAIITNIAYFDDCAITAVAHFRIINSNTVSSEWETPLTVTLDQVTETAQASSWTSDWHTVWKEVGDLAYVRVVFSGTRNCNPVSFDTNSVNDPY